MEGGNRREKEYGERGRKRIKRQQKGGKTKKLNIPFSLTKWRSLVRKSLPSSWGGTGKEGREKVRSGREKGLGA